MRRVLPATLVVVALAVLAACGPPSSGPDGGDASTTDPGPSVAAPDLDEDRTDLEGERDGDAPAGEEPGDADAPPDPEGELPEAPGRADPVVLSADEVYPNAKELAAAIAQAVTTYDVGQSLTEALADLGLDPASAEQLGREAAPLHHPERWSRGRVVYPQLGGVSDQRISVMVVTEQQFGTPEGIRTVTRTLDVRLQVVDGAWVFERLDDVGGQPPTSAGDPPDIARAVLDHDRIVLPDSARWDILSGHTEPLLLEVMARAAEEFQFEVVTLTSGHPERVFGTDRLSDHTRGRAVDIHVVEGTEVIDDRREDGATRRFVEWLYDQPEVAAVGSPWALDGFGGRSFTDVVHQDHVHLAVQPPKWGQAAVTQPRAQRSSSTTAPGDGRG